MIFFEMQSFFLFFVDASNRNHVVDKDAPNVSP